MKQFTLNLESRMTTVFNQQNLFSAVDRIQSYKENLRISEASALLLRAEYDKKLGGRKVKDEIHFHKICFPIIEQWRIFYEYFINMELELILIAEPLRSPKLKQNLFKLNEGFKKKPLL